MPEARVCSTNWRKCGWKDFAQGPVRQEEWKTKPRGGWRRERSELSPRLAAGWLTDCWYQRQKGEVKGELAEEGREDLGSAAEEAEAGSGAGD